MTNELAGEKHGSIQKARAFWIRTTPMGCSFIAVGLFASLLLQANRANPGRNASITIGPQHITCSECELDLGDIDPFHKPEVKHTFSIYNSLNESISIEKITPSCGCLLLESHPSQVPPKSTIALPIKYSVSNIPGRVQRLVHISFGNPLNQGVDLSVTGNVKASAVMQSIPTIIDFGVIPMGETRQRSVKISKLNLSKMRQHNYIASFVDVGPGGLNIPCQLTSDADRDTALILTATASNESHVSGRIHGVIRVKSADTDSLAIEVPVRGNLSGVDSYLNRSIVVTDDTSEQSADVFLSHMPQEFIPKLINARYAGPNSGQVLLHCNSANEAGKLFVCISNNFPKNTIYGQSTVLRGAVFLQFEGDFPEYAIPITIRSATP